MPTRRNFLQSLGLATALAGSASLPATAATEKARHAPVRPARLKKGDTVALVAPAGVTYESDYLRMAQESLQALGLKPKVGQHVLSRFGYLAGNDEHRAADINNAFADKEVKAIFCLRGGWGAARLLPFVDFEVIADNPKIFMGYSDITTLLNAIYARTGLVTFHGPNGGSPWHDFSVTKMRQILFDADTITMNPHPKKDGTLTYRSNRIQTIVPGTTKGPLVGGNLTLVTNLLGTPYFPNVDGHLLLLEEIGEYVYRCDRMLTQLGNAGVLDRVAGVVLGSFTDCTVEPSGGYGNFSLMDIFEHHFGHRNKPTYFGALFGHLPEKYTLPLGINAEIDADSGTTKLLAPAVS